MQGEDSGACQWAPLFFNLTGSQIKHVAGELVRTLRLLYPKPRQASSDHDPLAIVTTDSPLVDPVLQQDTVGKLLQALVRQLVLDEALTNPDLWAKPPDQPSVAPLLGPIAHQTLRQEWDAQCPLSGRVLLDIHSSRLLAQNADGTASLSILPPLPATTSAAAAAHCIAQVTDRCSLCT